MKYVFISAFITMSLMSVVAFFWVPEIPDSRVERLDIFLSSADANGDHNISLDEVHQLFNRLDLNSDGVITFEDVPRRDSDSMVDHAFMTNFMEFMDDDGDDQVQPAELETAFNYVNRDNDQVLTAQDMPESPPIELVWVTDDNPVRREQVRLFNRLYPGYQLRIDPQNAGLEKIMVQCLAGVGPDLFDCYNGYDLASFVRSEIAMDVTEEFEKRGIDPDALWPCILPLVEMQGRYYGHPRNANAFAMWYNKAIFDQAGVPYPKDDWTWEECIKLCDKLTVRNERGQITRYGVIGLWDWKLGIYKYKAHVFTPERTRCMLDSPEAIQGFQFMQDLVNKYEVMPSLAAENALASSGGWGKGPLSLFAAERGAMAVGGRWWLCILRNPEFDNLKLGAVELPGRKLPDGTISRRIYGGGGSTLVNKASHNIEGALKFLEYLHSKDWNDLINRQADALAPVRKYNYTDTFLHDPAHPEEDYNAVWRTALENAVPEEVSPFVNGRRVDRIMQKQTELLRGNQKSAEAVGKTAAQEINAHIIEILKRDPELMERYKKLIEQGARPAWDDPADTPWEED